MKHQTANGIPRNCPRQPEENEDNFVLALFLILGRVRYEKMKAESDIQNTNLIFECSTWLCTVHRTITTESFMKTRDMVSMPHPPYWPDLASHDLYLFPIVKERLDDTGITHEDPLFEELPTILRSIPGQELERVFEAWQECVQNVNQTDGGYTD
jgi:hypothetical protein